MTDRVRIVIEADGDDAVREAQDISRAYDRMGKDVARSTKDAERGMQGFSQSAKRVGDALDEVGTAVGVAVSAVALLGRNNRDAERSVDALRRAYGDEADAILDATEAIQDHTNFSNDAARQAALTGASLAQNYGLAADQIETLIGVSADLATIHGIELPDAMSRVAGAIRGEGEAAEILGLNMSDAAVASQAAAAGLTTWNTTMTEGEKAAFRYSVLVDQAAFATGAAGDAAQGAAGRGYDLVQFLDDAAESAGAALGPAGEFLSVAGDLALAAPLAGNALGRMAQGLGRVAESTRLASTASAGLGLIAGAGPLGLVAATAAATGGVILLADALSDGYTPATEAATDGTQSLTDALGAMAVAGAEAMALEQGQGILDFWNQLAAEATAAAEVARDAQETITTGGPIDAAQQQRIRDAQATLQEFANEYGVAVSEIGNLTEDLNADLVAASTYVGENAEAVRTAVLETLDLMARGVENGGITFKEGARRIDEITGSMESFGAVLPGTQRAIDGISAALNPWSDGQVEATRTAEDLAEAEKELAAGLAVVEAGIREVTAARQAGQDAARAEYDASRERVEAAEDEFRANMALLGSYGGLARIGAGVGNIDVGNPFAGSELADVNVEGMDQFRELSAATLEYNAALRLAADGVLTLAEQQDVLTASQGVLGEQLGDYRTQLGYTEEAERILRERQAAGLALTAEQIAFLERVDAVQADATASAEDLAVQQGIMALAWLENAESQQDLADSNRDLNDTMTELGDVLGDFIADWRDLLGLPPADNLEIPDDVLGSMQRARDLMNDLIDDRNRQHALGSDVSGTGAPANQPPPALPPDLVTLERRTVSVDADWSGVQAAAVAAAGFLENQLVGRDWIAGLFADASDLLGDAENAESTMRAVADGEYEAALNADPSDALGDVGTVEGALAALDGQSATVRAYAEIAQARADINSLLGFQGDAFIVVNAVAGALNPFAHGGVVGAQHGRVITVGEAGPERVVLPIGSYVRPAPATRGDGRDGGITINLTVQGSINGVDDLERHIFRAMAAAAPIGVGNRRTELGIRS